MNGIKNVYYSYPNGTFSPDLFFYSIVCKEDETDHPKERNLKIWHKIQMNNDAINNSENNYIYRVTLMIKIKDLRPLLPGYNGLKSEEKNVQSREVLL